MTRANPAAKHTDSATRVSTADKKVRAMELARQGFTYEAIAKEIGVKTRGAAYKIVQKAIAEHVAPAVDEYRVVQLDRLRDMWMRLQKGIIAGDVPSIQAGIKLIDAEAKLTGTYAPMEQSGEVKIIIERVSHGAV